MWRLFGTWHDRVPVYGSGGWLSYSVKELVEEARSFESQTLERVIFAVFGGEAYEAFSSSLSSPLPDGS